VNDNGLGRRTFGLAGALLALLKVKPVDNAAHDAATSPLNLKRPPTERQAKAGNYPKGHTSVAGIQISIENPAGSLRSAKWAPLSAHYGYIRGTDGADGDQVDVFVRPGTANDWVGDVYVVNQLDASGSFDEHKAMIGWADERSAVRAYAANYPRGWRVGPVSTMRSSDFRNWVRNGNHKAPIEKLTGVLALLKYSPDQPRDELGRWTDEGGGGAAGGAAAIESRFASKLGMTAIGKDASGATQYHVTDETKFAAAVQEYHALAEKDAPGLGDRILNTDIARELSKDYLADRSQSAAVHEPASTFIKELYARRLAAETPTGRAPVVLFTAGGTGAGKSTGMTLQENKGMVAKADVIYDTNMNTYGSGAKKIDQALASGRDVQVLFVHRDAVDALVSGALPRAMRQEKQFGSGRTVPLAEHAKTHEGAYTTVKAIGENYAATGRVSVNVVDNSRGRGGAKVSSLSEISQPKVSMEALKGALNEQFKAGKISSTVYTGFAGHPPGG